MVTLSSRAKKKIKQRELCYIKNKKGKFKPIKRIIYDECNGAGMINYNNQYLAVKLVVGTHGKYWIQA